MLEKKLIDFYFGKLIKDAAEIPRINPLQANVTFLYHQTFSGDVEMQYWLKMGWRSYIVGQMYV